LTPKTRASKGAESFVARASREQPGTWELAGSIDENADLSFFRALHGPSRLNLRQIKRMNSHGVRSWLENIRKMPGTATLELIECSPVMIDQLSMVTGLLGRGRVVSFYVSLPCLRCGYEHEELFFTEDYRRDGHLPAVSCPRCATTLELGEVESQYGQLGRGK